MYIVQGEQADAEYFVAHEEMPNVRPGETGAGCTVAALIQRQGIVAVLGALDVEAAGAREDCSVSSHPRWCNAVEHVDASVDALDQILREPDTHEVAWLRAGKGVVQDVEHLVHGGLRLADRKSADRVSMPVVHRGQRCSCFLSQRRMNAALHDR